MSLIIIIRSFLRRRLLNQRLTPPRAATPYYTLSADPTLNYSRIVFHWQAPARLGKGATAITGYESQVQEINEDGSVRVAWTSSHTATGLSRPYIRVPDDTEWQCRVRATNNAPTPVTSDWLTYAPVHVDISSGRRLYIGLRPLSLGDRKMYIGSP